MEDYDVRSAASILASVKEQEARFERLTRALEEERRNVSLQLERANLPADLTTAGCTTVAAGQPLAWQQVVMQVKRTFRNVCPLIIPAPRQAACILPSVCPPSAPTACRSHSRSSTQRIVHPHACCPCPESSGGLRAWRHDSVALSFI
ncbi:hypothetical protein AALO_G00064930 [Alosa alosa]|uniref:Uncharacterized protein n=1 Tax=Alosa alosa TaxID=278164 RepID=A0AAV6H0Q9_9TELE|nr:hypothetical protein AALO_G00064930 [Alosa alosa]